MLLSNLGFVMGYGKRALQQRPKKPMTLRLGSWENNDFRAVEENELGTCVLFILGALLRYCI